MITFYDDLSPVHWHIRSMTFPKRCSVCEKVILRKHHVKGCALDSGASNSVYAPDQHLKVFCCLECKTLYLLQSNVGVPTQLKQT